jgi:hypothetical protein
MQIFIDILWNLWAVLADMAPWLVIGFLFAGVLSVFFKPAWVQRHLGKPGWVSIFKASAFGVPLPLCSCGVIPVGTMMYRHGASKGATASFLLSTPQTGVDSILATWGLLGPLFAITRPVIALVNGFLGGIAIDKLTSDEPRGQVDPQGDCCSTQSACCSTQEACCDSQVDTERSEASAPPGTPGLLAKLFTALRYGLITLPADIAWSLMVGIVIAALLTALVPPDAVAAYVGGGLLAMVAAVLIGVPLYVCSVGSIPIALGLMHAGASPGAALAFMIAGPATNAATVAVTWRVLGRRAGFVYLLSVLITAIGSGFAFDALAGRVDWGLPGVYEHLHEHGLRWIDHAWAAGLLAIITAGLWVRYKPRGASEPGHVGPDTSVREDAGLVADSVRAGTARLTRTERLTGDGALTLTITGMSCSHCADAVTQTLREQPRVREAHVDLREGLAFVNGESLDAEQLATAVRGLGYDAAVKQ